MKELEMANLIRKRNYNVNNRINNHEKITPNKILTRVSKLESINTTSGTPTTTTMTRTSYFNNIPIISTTPTMINNKNNLNTMPRISEIEIDNNIDMDQLAFHRLSSYSSPSSSTSPSRRTTATATVTNSFNGLKLDIISNVNLPKLIVNDKSDTQSVDNNGLELISLPPSIEEEDEPQSDDDDDDKDIGIDGDIIYDHKPNILNFDSQQTITMMDDDVDNNDQKKTKIENDTNLNINDKMKSKSIENVKPDIKINDKNNETIKKSKQKKKKKKSRKHHPILIQFLPIIFKLSLLSLWISISTIFLGFMLWSLYPTLSSLIDSTINSFCVYLSFAFATPMYNIFCLPFYSCKKCKKIGKNITNHQMSNLNHIPQTRLNRQTTIDLI